MSATGAAALFLYVLTLSPGVYPGVSAAWVSAATGLQPWETAEHPLWRLFVTFWQHIPLGSAVWRLNLSSAVCGAVAAALLCRYVACWVYAHLQSQTEENHEPTEEDRREERTASLVAVVSGAAAAVLFVTGLAGWSAATRLRPEAFDLMLVLAAFALYQDYTRLRGTWRLYALAFLCGAGAAESVLFWVAAVYLVLAQVVFLYRHYRLRFGLCLGLMVTGGLGLGLYVLSAWAFAQASATGAADADWHFVLRQVLKLQFSELALFLPRVGWPFVLLLLAVPWLAFQAGFWERLHWQRNYRADALLTLLLLVLLVLQFNVPVPPWPLWRQMGRLPVLEAAVAAMLGGWTCAYWAYGALFRWEPDQLVAGLDLLRLEKRIRQKRWLALGACSFLLALTVGAALCSAWLACGRRGAFADRCAQEILDQLGGRTWLMTDGLLDPHLSALADAQGRTLHVLSLAAERDAEQIRRMRRWVSEEPRMRENRDRLLNAANLGVGSFVREWLAADPKAADTLALYCVPDVWSEAGLTVVPDRFLLLAVGSPDSLRQRPLLEEHRAFWKRMDRLLPPVAEKADAEPVDVIRHLLRMHLSLIANDLGVLLMELGRDGEAFDAFGEALELEPNNLSAMANRTLLVRKGVRPSEQIRVENAFKKALAAIKRQPLTFDVVRRYGQIRSPEALVGVGMAWAQLGQYGLAQKDVRRAAALADDVRTRDAILASLGGVSLKAGDTEGGEKVFRSLLDKDSGNKAAIMGMLKLALGRGDAAEGRRWLAKAQDAGVTSSALAFAAAQLDIVGCAYDSARERLLSLTDREPQNLDAWTLLAAALIHLQRLDDVERQVLPKMEAVVGKRPHALVYQVRGDLARARGPASYDAARDAYRSSLKLSPGKLDLLEALLSLDLLLQDQAAAGRDAADLLRADPDNANGLFVLGTQALMRGETGAAETHLRKSVARRATSEALNNLAEVLLKKGALEEAENAARQALAKADKNASVLDTLATVLLKREKTSEALTVIGQARALAPGDWILAFTEARILMGSGRKEEARVLLKNVRDHFDSLPPHMREEVVRVTQEWRSPR